MAFALLTALKIGECISFLEICLIDYLPVICLNNLNNVSNSEEITAAPI